MRRIGAAFLVLMLSACAGQNLQPGHLSLSKADYADFAGWQSDKISEVVPALTRSCSIMTKKSPSVTNVAGRGSDWVQPCAALAAVPPGDDRAARAVFEEYFRPYALNGGDGLFTGYYEAELHGSHTKHGRFTVPLYERPDDLVQVDLGLFRPAWKGTHIAGKVIKNKLQPYDDRGAIAQGSLNKRAKILLWVDDPVDAFFLSVQGSGRVKMDDGSVVRLGYDGGNGQDYVSIGAVMRDGGMLERPVTMQSIRAWLTAHPEHAQTVMNNNPNYVFFRVLKEDGPLGAEGVPLTPMRSMAVDSTYIPLGMPLWLDTADSHNEPLQRVMVAQDVGGAIKGPMRGDFFWGYGHDAEAQAGAMQSRGTYYLLLPRTVTPNAD